MLCRNINPRLGLVNGSTGVLKDIIKIDNVPIELVIKFDRIDELQRISKASSVFTIGLDEQCSRHQFPVKMSFAATMHKCQGIFIKNSTVYLFNSTYSLGLTLQNVVISMKHSFTAGQIFVACSRVENGLGLHLADYYPEKIKVDLASLNQYNYHRQSIGLSTYPMPTAITKSTNKPKKKINTIYASQTKSILLIKKIY